MRIGERLAAMDEWVLSLGHRRVPADRRSPPRWFRWWFFGAVGAVATVIGGLISGKPPSMVMLSVALWLGLGLPLGWVRWAPRR